MQQNDMEYLQQKFNPFLIPLLKELIQKKPENSYEFILEWIDTKGLEIQQGLQKGSEA